MNKAHQQVIKDIQSSPEGPQIAALFDFDGTIIAGFSSNEFILEQIKQKKISRTQLMEMVGTMTSYSMGKIGFSGLMLAGAKSMEGIKEKDYIAFSEEVYKKSIADSIYPESRTLIEAHLAKGHTVAIVSSATPYQVEPAARELGIKHVLCSHYEVKNGEFTGDIIRPFCFGEGKVIAAEKLAKKLKLDLDNSFFYSDSDDDIELLEHVGNPRPLNPNTGLTEIAENRGWPIQRFNSRGRPSMKEFLRTITASLVMLPAAAASLPLWALSGSKKEAQNFTAAVSANAATALIGLKLNVTGEHHLWEHRPAVVIYNHRCKADTLIIPKLLRQDYIAIAKKEAGDTPLFGKLLEYAGTVFIDRENTASAIEALNPVIDAIRNQGKSVYIAPEGTRSKSGKLLPFKKGAFHIAMQAGVPIIPIVLHNATDVVARNGAVYRPGTVHVEILPPVDTSKWNPDSLDTHVADVRKMFLDALGEEDQAETAKKPAVKRKSAARQPQGRKPRTPKARTTKNKA